MGRKVAASCALIIAFVSAYAGQIELLIGHPFMGTALLITSVTFALGYTLEVSGGK